MTLLRGYTGVVPTVRIIYASTSGHTEYVAGIVAETLRMGGLDVSATRAEKATAEDLTASDLVILGSGTWNTGGPEGQLNPHMQAFVFGPAKAAELKGKNVAVIALGDERYRYTARAGEHLKNFVQSHGGKVFGEQLTIVNEPYGQEERVKKWAGTIVTSLLR